MNQCTAVWASLENVTMDVLVSKQCTTYLMTGQDDLFVLYTLNFNIHGNSKPTNLLRLSEVDVGMDHGVFHCVVLSQATGHHLQRAKETRCRSRRPSEMEKRWQKVRTRVAHREELLRIRSIAWSTQRLWTGEFQRQGRLVCRVNLSVASLACGARGRGVLCSVRVCDSDTRENPEGRAVP